jgi:hypothetical protein
MRKYKAWARQTNRQRYRKTDGPKDRQAGRQKERQK